jgi:hypothetical protein
VDPPDTGPVGVDVTRPDSGPIPEGCHPDVGIECDGDWADRCTPGCPDTQCCSPQGGRFECVDRDAGGACPAANLWVDTTRIVDQYAVEWQSFAADDCALVERCVSGSGWRRLLRFDTWTPNTGTADMFLGVPDMSSPYFEYSSCHDHYHFNTYAEYDLLNMDGTVAAIGHKQAFCLLDFYRYPGTDGSGAHYDCGNQGIQRDWQDVYDSGLDCQWVDVTDVAPGNYMLRIRINTLHILNETDYTDNEVIVPVVIDAAMPPSVTNPCDGGTTGAGRDCGWEVEGTHTCTPGAMVTAACSATCGLGSCDGDSILRVCAGTMPCSAAEAIGQNDDSGCGSRDCGEAGGDCCSQEMFTCPAGGMYTVLVGAYEAGTAIDCTVATSP